MGLLEADRLRLNFRQVKTVVRSLIDQFVEGTELRLEQAGVEVVKGAGRIATLGVVEGLDTHGEGGDSHQEYHSRVWARPAMTTVEAGGGELVLPSRDILEMEDLPASVMVIGGNYIGAGLACALNEFGVQVTLVEAAKTILPVRMKRSLDCSERPWRSKA
jgi:dihydrolipoamide dehydrogenase